MPGFHARLTSDPVSERMLTSCNDAREGESTGGNHCSIPMSAHTLIVRWADAAMFHLASSRMVSHPDTRE